MLQGAEKKDVRRKTKHMVAALALAVALPVTVGALAGWITRGDSRGDWYLALRKPSWNPPSYVFAPVWTTLYVLMGVASWLAWRGGAPAGGLALYGAQLALNFAWSLLFFRARSPRWALVDIVALLGVLAATASAFWRADAVAGLLLLPYIAWVAFATALNASIVSLNP